MCLRWDPDPSMCWGWDLESRNTLRVGPGSLHVLKVGARSPPRAWGGDWSPPTFSGQELDLPPHAPARPGSPNSLGAGAGFPVHAGSRIQTPENVLRAGPGSPLPQCPAPCGAHAGCCPPNPRLWRATSIPLFFLYNVSLPPPIKQEPTMAQPPLHRYTPLFAAAAPGDPQLPLSGGGGHIHWGGEEGWDQ